MNKEELLKKLPKLLEATITAGDVAMSIYEKADPGVKYKADNSPVTEADLAVNSIVTKALHEVGEIDVISEEALIPYDQRKDWNDYWLIDPIDGTKEFIRKTGEFTINIGYVSDGVPQFGIIYVPVSRQLYFGGLLLGKSYKIHVHPHGLLWSDKREISVRSYFPVPTGKSFPVRITCSKDHKSEHYAEFIENFTKYTHYNEEVPCGSTIKIAQIAQGDAHIYVRLSGINDWDLAAGHAIVIGAGGSVYDIDRKRLEYNTESQKILPFVIVGPTNLPWYQAIPSGLRDS